MLKNRIKLHRKSKAASNESCTSLPLPYVLTVHNALCDVGLNKTTNCSKGYTLFLNRITTVTKSEKRKTLSTRAFRFVSIGPYSREAAPAHVGQCECENVSSRSEHRNGANANV